MFDQDISDWDVSNVTDMSGMFDGAAQFNADLSAWDVSNVTDMSRMFSRAAQFNADLSDWDTSKVGKMSYIFQYASAFDQNLGNWNIQNVSDMTEAFVYTNLSTSNYSQMLIDWNDQMLIYWNDQTLAPQVVVLDASATYNRAAEAARQSLIDEWQWKITDLGLVADAATDTDIDPTAPAFVSVWKTDADGKSTVRQIALPTVADGAYHFSVDWGDGSTEIITEYDKAVHMYPQSGIYEVTIRGTFERWSFDDNADRKGISDAPKLLEIKNWGPLKLGDSTGQFYGCQNLRITATDVPDLSNTRSLARAFGNCASIVEIPSLNQWETAHITDMSEMFYNAIAFDQEIGNLNTSSVRNMESMFKRAISFDGDISAWDTSKVTTMDEMFQYALFFNQDISGWDVCNVVSRYEMFYGARLFDQDLSDWDDRSECPQ